MKLDNQIIQKLTEFYMKTPNKILDTIFKETNIERCLSGNTRQEKINSLLSNASPHNGKRRLNISCWQYFIKTAEIYFSNASAELDNHFISISSNISKIVDNGNEALLKVNIKKLVKSNEFNIYINNDNITTPKHTSQDPSNNLHDPISSNTEYDFKNKKKEHETMKYYLGHIELNKTYFNFNPQYILKNDYIEEISQLHERFPTHGILNLSYKFNYPSHTFLKDKHVDYKDDNERCRSLYCVCFNENELQDNDNEKILKKLDLQYLYENKINLSDRIKPLIDFGMYKVVTSQSNISDMDFINNLIIIKENEYPASEKVLLEYNDNLYGPYILQERSIDGLKYIKPDIGSKKYLLEYYSISENDCDCYDFEKQRYMQEPIYTQVAEIVSSPRIRDIIPDSILLSKLNDNINLDLFKESPEEFERLYLTSPFLGDISEDIKRFRFKRIRELFTNALHYDDEKKKAISTLINNSGDDIQSLLGNAIKESSVYKDIIKENLNFKNEIDELNKLKEKLESENRILQEESIHYQNFDDEKYNEKILIYENLEDEINQLGKKHEKLSCIADLDKEKARLDNLYDDLIIKVSKQENNLKKLKEQEQDLIKQAQNAILEGVEESKVAQTAFDPYISNAMLQAAVRWSEDKEKDNFNQMAKESVNIKPKSKERKELISYLVQGVQKFRNYNENDIINMFICMSQNFLTIFSGEPGTGKTSICNILANSLGLNKFLTENDKIANRFISVSVERGWSSKRDLIGYFNPLSKKYDKNNGKIYDGLMLLNEEKENSQFPYVILLDEANLSPMEYYWADFMRVTDRNDEDMYINIGLDSDIYIPKTLRFLATINNDQTTEQISPRLIDRTWVIRLPNVDIKYNITENPSSYFKDFVSWKDVEKTFITSESKEEILKSVLEDIYKCFEKRQISVSPRVKQSIKNYVCVAQEIMIDEPSDYVLKKEKALDFAIVQKLLPKINGYYDNYKILFDDLLPICVDNHLFMTKDAIEEMKSYAEQHMGYCQYLV